MFNNIFSFSKGLIGESHKKPVDNDGLIKAGNKALELNSLPIDVFLDASTILKEPKISLLVRKIRTLSGVSDEYFDAYYLPVFEVCSIFCQSAPASKENHHSYHFGLITHLIETALYAIRARLNFVYKVTNKEEDIDNYKNIYTYAVFVAAMNHDMGKIISDNRYFIRLNSDEKYHSWSPLSSYPPAESEKVQYKIERKINKQGKFIYKYNSHSIMNTSLLCRTVPNCGWAWITSLHPKLEVDIFHAVSGDYENADVIGKSVKAADALSSKESMDSKVTSILNGNSKENVPPLLKILKKIIADPVQHSLTVNNSGFTTLVKKEGLIYIAGGALEKSIRDEAPNHSLSLPNSSNKLEAMVTDHFTLPAASGDTMWWMSFSSNAQQMIENKKKKDVKCFVFDADIFDSNDMLPEAKGITIHRSIKSMSDDERKNESKIIVKSVSENEIEEASHEKGSDKSIIKKHNSNLKIGGGALNEKVTTVAVDVDPTAEIKKSFTDSINGKTDKHASLENEPVQIKAEYPSKKEKSQFKGVKATDLLKLIEMGKEGSPNSNRIEEQINKPGTPKNNQVKNSNAVSKNNTRNQSKKIIQKPNENLAKTKVDTLSKEDTKPKGELVKKGLAPKSGADNSVLGLMPSFSALKKAKNEKPVTPALQPMEPEPIQLAEEPMEPIQLAEEPMEPIQLAEERMEPIQLAEERMEPIQLAEERMEPIQLADSFPQVHFDPSDGYLSGTHSEYPEQSLIPYSNQWEQVTENDFNAVINENQVKFKGENSEFNEQVSVNTKMFSSPLWAPNIKPKPEDSAFIDELFGVLQQAINNGLQFNRIGSRLYVVPHGIFLVSPSSFESSDFPLSTRGSYYKDKIRNSSYLARVGLDKHRTVVTGRVLRTKKNNSGGLKVKTTGALNGFYLVTGNRNKLKHNNLEIKPTSHLIFDSYSVNGVVKLD